jgi:hypothetical protein
LRRFSTHAELYVLDQVLRPDGAAAAAEDLGLGSCSTITTPRRRLQYSYDLDRRHRLRTTIARMRQELDRSAGLRFVSTRLIAAVEAASASLVSPSDLTFGAGLASSGNPR